MKCKKIHSFGPESRLPISHSRLVRLWKHEVVTCSVCVMSEAYTEFYIELLELSDMFSFVMY